MGKLLTVIMTINCINDNKRKCHYDTLRFINTVIQPLTNGTKTAFTLT